MMKRRVPVWAFVALLVNVGCMVPSGVWAQEEAIEASKENLQPKVLEFDELLKLATDSKWNYKVEVLPENVSVEELVEELWPLSEPPVGFRIESQDDGTRSLGPWICSEAALEAIANGEAVFAQRDYAAAADFYRQAIAEDPECYVAYMTLGDAVLFGQKDSATALVHYEAAAKLNPLDYRPHFFRGSALIRMGRTQAAREAWQQALALRPNYPVLRQIIDGNPHLGLRMHGPFLRPVIRLQKEERKFLVATSPDWFVYGMCKALWRTGDRSEEDLAGTEPDETEPGLGEAIEEDAKPAVKESRRQRRARRKRERRAVAKSGRAEHSTKAKADELPSSFSTEEEMECLGHQLVFYENSKTSADFVEDPGQEALLEISRAGYLDAAALYEVIGRVAPQGIPLLPDEARARLLEFVRRFVMP